MGRADHRSTGVRGIWLWVVTVDEPDIRALLVGLKLNIKNVTYAGSVKRTRWMNISCPFAAWTHARGTDTNPSFGITINAEGRSNYKCLACGLKGRLSSLPSRLGGYRKEDNSELRHWAELTEMQAGRNRPVPDWEDGAHDDEQTHDRAIPDPQLVYGYPLAVGIPYLRKRGLQLPSIYRLGIRYDDYQSRVLFPCYDRADRFRGFTGRSTVEGNNETRGRNPKVRDYYGLNKRELFLGLRGKQPGIRIIVEGLFDYATLVQAGYPATRAILGTSLTDEKVDILIQEAAPVHFFMDNDLAGWTALFGYADEDGELVTDNAWAFRLYTEIPVWIVPYPRGLDGTDPGSLSKKQIDAAIKRAWLFTGKLPVDELGLPDLRRPI